jgi:phosphatidylethanolamine/phosphatidyl-N-methylethanolamine N-methyltransferase
MLVFFEQCLRDFRHTGALLPSSAVLARTMTRSMRKDRGPMRVLEVGPGTGPFTKVMLQLLKPGDELHIVEINPQFARLIEQRYLAPFRARHPDIVVRLYCQPIESVKLEGTFDHIICGLPFNNFPPALVRSIFRRLMSLLSPGGELSYFEYAGVRMFKAPMVGRKGREKLKNIGVMGKVLRRKHLGKRKLVLGNLPPAIAVRLVR